jgi:hypothetical protein
VHSVLSSHGFNVLLFLSRFTPFYGSHGECAFVEDGDHSLLSQKQFDNSLTFMKVKFQVFFTSFRSDRLANVFDLDAESRMIDGVLFLLSLFDLSLSFSFDLINSLAESHFQFSFLMHFFVILKSSTLKLLAFVFHHFSKLFDDSFITTNLIFLSFNFSFRLVNDRP